MGLLARREPLDIWPPDTADGHVNLWLVVLDDGRQPLAWGVALFTPAIHNGRPSFRVEPRAEALAVRRKGRPTWVCIAAQRSTGEFGVFHPAVPMEMDNDRVVRPGDLLDAHVWLTWQS